MRDYRFGSGLILTVVWIGLVTYLLFRDPSATSKMTPNDWGSFLSGAFAPLAFLWLIIGYMQQGEELRLSTKALQLQAEELRNSVEQQRALVEVSRLQVESEREALLEERQERLQAARPNIVLYSDGGSFRGDGYSTYPVNFANSGNTAYGVKISICFPLGRVQELFNKPTFESGASQQARVEVERPELIEGATLEVRFGDRLGNQFFEKYLVFRQSDHPHASLRMVFNTA